LAGERDRVPVRCGPAERGLSGRAGGVDENARLAREYLASAAALPAEWQDAAGFATYGLRVTADELVSIGTALDEVLRPYIGATREDPPEGARAVHVTVQVFARADST
jgi:hypothetical protein